MRAMVEYALRMNNDVDRCLGGRITSGKIGYWLRWTVDLADPLVGVATADRFEIDRELVSEVSDAQVEWFGECAQAYFYAHDLPLPGYRLDEFHWARVAHFPMESAPVYKDIAAANTGQQH